MLDEFIRDHRELIMARARARASARTSPMPSDVGSTSGIPVFLDQLVLRLAKSTDVLVHEDPPGTDLLRMGLAVARFIEDYADASQAIIELTMENDVSLSDQESQMLVLCLDDAIAGAIGDYARSRRCAVFEEEFECAEMVGRATPELTRPQ